MRMSSRSIIIILVLVLGGWDCNPNCRDRDDDYCDEENPHTMGDSSQTGEGCYNDNDCDDKNPYTVDKCMGNNGCHHYYLQKEEENPPTINSPSSPSSEEEDTPQYLVITFTGCSSGGVYYWAGVDPMDPTKPKVEGEVENGKPIKIEWGTLCEWGLYGKPLPQFAVNCRDFKGGGEMIKIKNSHLEFPDGSKRIIFCTKDNTFYQSEDSQYGWGKVLIQCLEATEFCGG